MFFKIIDHLKNTMGEKRKAGKWHVDISLITRLNKPAAL
jgi:hypothetical protein